MRHLYSRSFHNMHLLLMVPILTVLAACSGQPIIVEPPPDTDAIRLHRVYVVSNGWHAGLVVPGHEIHPILPDLATRFGDVAFYEFGWGDKGFYQSQAVTTGLALQAMFWSEGAVMHVEAIPGSLQTYFRGNVVIDTCLTQQEFASLKTFLANSFAHDAEGHLIALRRDGDGVRQFSDQFYDGIGRYYLFNTCNKWTAKALRSAGLDIAPTLALTADRVISYLATHRKECSKPSPYIEAPSGSQ